MTPSKQQYDPIQAPYDYIRTSTIAQIEHDNVRTTLAPFIPNARVLELACGSGFYTYSLLEWGARSVLGVDISPVMMDKARSVGEEVGAGERVSFIQADCAIPKAYEGGPFDIVFGAWLLNYAPDREGLVEMFRNVAMNLKDGGRFVSITVPPSSNPIDSLNAEARARPEPEGSGYLMYKYIKDVEGGIFFGVHGETPVGKLYFECYHLRKEVYEEAAREAGLKGRMEWGVTEVPERFLTEEAPGGATLRELETYKSIPAHGVFLLPSLVCTSVVVLGVLVGFFFLEETHHEKKYERDFGLEMGKHILAIFQQKKDTYRLKTEKRISLISGETDLLIDDFEQLLGYQSKEGSPQINVPAQLDNSDILSLDNSGFVPKPEKGAPSKPFTTQILLSIAGYGILAYHTITFDQLLPLFLSHEETKNPVIALPFKFLGGFHMSPKEVSVILTVQGIYSMFASVVLFPFAVKRLGALNLFKLVAFSYPVLYVVTPYVILLPKPYRPIGLFPLLAWKTTFANFAFPATNILLANTAPSLLLLGTINGAASSTASFCRGLGPLISGALYDFGFGAGYFGIVWWLTAIVAAAGAAIAMGISEKGFRKDMDDAVEDEEAVVV